MVRIISKSLMVLALAGFFVPATTYDADAGRRYKSSGKYHGNSMRRSHRRNNGFIFRIPSSYLYDGRVDGYANNYSEPKYYRGGPKIINVPEALRERRKRELLEN